MRKIYIFFLLTFFVGKIINAQVSNYAFAESAGSYSVLGGTNSTATGDDGIQDGIPIGFNFVFGGTTMTHFCINTNGWIKLGSSTTTIGASGWTNSLSNTAVHRPLIAALWDDNHRNTGAITYSTTGTAPTRVLTVDWNNVNIGGGGSTSAANLASYQIKIYETTNIVEIIYGGTLALAGTLSASVGLNDNTSFLSVTPGAPATTSNATANNAISATTSMVSRKYTFTPPTCAAPGGLTNTLLSTTAANHSWSAAVPVPSNGYEWAVTTSATPPASGTATTGLTANSTGLTANTTYYLHVRSNCGGTFSGWATASFFTGYCQFSGTVATSYFDAFSTTGGSTNINNAASGYSTNGYGNFTAQKVTQQQGSPINFAGTLVVADEGVGIWVDWNDNLIFESTERMYTSNAYLTSLSGSFTVPATAPIGNHRMRIVMDYNSINPSPCALGFGRGEAEDYTFEVTGGTPCTGAPAGVNVTPGISTYCNATNSTVLTATTTSPGTGITFQWQSSPGGANSFTNISGANTNSYTATNVAATTDYRCVLTCSGNSTTSNVVTIDISATVANDLVCNAITLVLNGSAHCGNTTCATSTGDPSFSSSTPNNTVWYSFTPTTTGVYNFEMTRPSGVTTGLLNGWLGVYTATGTCPGTLTFAEVTPALASYNLTTSATVTLVTPSLTAGTTYYFMVDGVGGAFGAYCIALKSPPPPPPCTTNITPVNAATGVTSVITGVPLSWNAAPGATSYDLYFGTTNPPTANLGNTTLTNTSITGTAYNTTYYWYAVPRNAGGAATGCTANVTSFTTELAPNNCVPIYTTGCGSSDRITLFRLKGETTELNINTGSACNPAAYVDSTDHSVIIDIARGKSYWGQAQCGFGSNYISAWIDANDNGQFENSERIINNLLVGTTLTNINFFVPLSTPAGNHRLRIRDVYYGTAPTAPTDPCSSYAFGETEDYTVNVTAGGTPYIVATYPSTGVCYEGVGQMTVDPASLSGQSFIPIVDSTNSLVAQLYPNGNDFGTVTASYYKHNAAVRQDATGRYYLDRNITISATKQPSSTYNLRLPYQNSELNALISQPGSGVTSQFDLVCTKITSNICLNAYAQQSPVLVSPTGFGSISGDRFLDFTNLTSLSTFFFHGGSTTLLPVTISDIRGEVTGSTNTVSWTTATEANNRKFVVERSTNGTSFAPIGEVATRAAGGNSSVALSYSYVDANPVQGKQYYRLQMVDNSGRATYSQIVTLRRGAGKLEIVDVRPNPTTANLYFNLLGVNNNSQFTLTLRTVEGKAVMIKNNFTPLGAGVMDLSKLANGMYILEAVDVKTNEKALFKIVKQ